MMKSFRDLQYIGTNIKRTLKPAQKWIYLSMAIYLAGAVIGSTFPDRFPFFNDQMKRLALGVSNLDAGAYIAKTLIHNLTGSYVAMCTITLFGAVPVLAAFYNGLALGWVAVCIPSLSTWAIIKMLIQHGIFEWPAMMIAWGYGLWRAYGKIKTNDVVLRQSYKQKWRQANRAYFTIILPLLIIAVLIEGRIHIIRDIFN